MIDKTKYFTNSPQEIKRQKRNTIISIVATIFFLVLGVVSMLVGLGISGWDFAAFFQQPIWSFLGIGGLIIGIVLIGVIVFKKGNKSYDI